ncbi:unnamed protein product [Effrenium voratum]|nr:unnamed protein product [Effrenium voratum]
MCLRILCLLPLGAALRAHHQQALDAEVGVAQSESTAAYFAAQFAGLADRAHASLWDALGSATVEYQGVTTWNDPPAELTVTANGVTLPPSGGERPGAVNTNRLLVTVRGLAPEVRVESLTLRKEATELPAGEMEVLRDGALVAFHDLPPESALTLDLGLNSSTTMSWGIRTADATSGDVQARIMFLPENFSSSNVTERDFLRQEKGKKFIAKELTIFDMNFASLQPELAVNGFEVDSTGSLAGPVEEVMKGMDGSEDFNVSIVVTKNKDCFLHTADDLSTLRSCVDEKNSTVLSTYQCFSFIAKTNLTLDLVKGDQIGGLESGCQVNITSNPIQAYSKECDGVQATLREERAVMPAKVFAFSKTHRSINVSRAQTMYVGTYLATQQEDQRKKVLQSYSGEVKNQSSTVSVQIGGENEEIQKVIADSIVASGRMIEEMEASGQRWWKEKTGRDTKGACFSVNFRHTKKGMQGLPIAHVDATSVTEWFKPGGAFPAEGLASFEEKLGMNISEALKHVVVTFNEWINAAGEPMEELPLTVLDTTSFEESVLNTAWFQGGLDSMSLPYSEKMRWYYKPLQRGEGYRFITSPHEGPGGTRRYVGSPHSAFQIMHNPSTNVTHKARQSFEFRCLLIDPSWSHEAEAVELPARPSEQELVHKATESMIAALIADPRDFQESLVDNEDFEEETPS